MTPKLHQIVDRYREYCETIPGAALGFGASEAELSANRAISVAGRSVALDDAYLELVRVVDGLGADGVRLYPIVRRTVTARNGQVIEQMGLSQANEHWREVYGHESELADWLIYGLDDTAFFIRHLSTGRFQQRSRRGLRMVCYECSAFEDGLWEAFKDALELEDEAE